jgi:cell division protein FtsI/penicillin-binding protein 2
MSQSGTAGVSRRLRLLLTVAAILVVVFMIRLIDFQIVRAEAISELSYEKRSTSRIVEAKRGDILDSK